MSIIKRTAADAMKDATTATHKAEELDAKAAEATTTADRMDAESVDALVNDPRQVDKITAGINSQQRLARAYTAKAGQHRAKATALKREALALEAAELHVKADKLQKDADKLDGEIQEAKARLEELDGTYWRRAPAVSPVDSPDGLGTSTIGKTDVMRQEIESIRITADNNRYYLATGRTARDKEDLNAELGSSHNVMIMPLSLQGYHTTELLHSVMTSELSMVEA